MSSTAHAHRTARRKRMRVRVHARLCSCAHSWPLSFCCSAVVPRPHSELCNIPTEEFILYSVIVLRQGVENYKNLCREKRYTVRPFKFDPAEDRAEQEKKVALASKKKSLWVSGMDGLAAASNSRGATEQLQRNGRRESEQQASSSSRRRARRFCVC